MANHLPTETAVLVTRLSTRLCAIPLADVSESMRPLPVEPVSWGPVYLRGLAVVRGAPVPVVDLGLLLGGERAAPDGRYVLLGAGGRKVAVAVDEVMGVRGLNDAVFYALPPLLQNSGSDLFSGLISNDDQLAFILSAARILPGDVWRMIETNGAGDR